METNNQIDLHISDEAKNKHIDLENLDFSRIILSDLISPRRQEILDGISKGVIGQNHAKNVLTDFIIQALTKIGKKKGTMGNLFFHGPTGVGKTEIVRSISEFFLGEPDAFIKVDCGELAESHSKTRLFGAPPSFVGYNNPPIINAKDITEPYLKAIEKGKLNPILNNLTSFSIILFDEVEKAHYEVIQSLLGALDQGVIKSTNPSFPDVNLSNTIVIFTSNIGEHTLDIQKEDKHMGFNIGENKDNIESKKVIGEAIKNNFSPEFRSRLDSLIRFDKLEKNEVLQIVDLIRSGLEYDIKSYYKNYPKININFSSDLQEYIFDNYHDESKGIRELERNFNLNIRRKIELLITFPQFGEKYDNKMGLLNFDFDIKNDEIVLSIDEYGIKRKKEVYKRVIKETGNTIEKLLEQDFEIFKEVKNANYINFSHAKDYPDYSFVEIYSKKYIVNEKEFISVTNDLYNSYHTIMGINFVNLKEINFSIPILRKLTSKIMKNYIENSNLDISIELYTYLNLVSIIKPICQTKDIDFAKVNKEILIYFATKGN